MNQPSENHRVLCVLVDPDDLPDAVRARLGQEDIDLEHRPDVFRGLARAGRWQPGVIILGADWLTPDECGFFDHVRQVVPSARLFIFGDERRAGSAYLELLSGRDVAPVGLDVLHDALRADHHRLGVPRDDESTTTEKIRDFGPASVALSADVLNASDEAVREPTNADDSIYGQSEPAGDAADAFAGLEDGRFADGEGDFSGDEYGADEDDDDSQPVRVPWLRYEQRPQRTPPKTSSRLTADDDTESSRLGNHVKRAGDDALVDDPPLLSTEELEALLGEGPIE